MDALHKMLKWIDHNRGVVAGLVLTALVAGWLVGCEPTTQSIKDADRQVTAAEFEREVLDEKAALEARTVLLEQDAELLAQRAEVGAADLERQYELRRQILTAVGALGSDLAEGDFSAPGLINGIVSILLLGLAGGAVYDNRRKDRVIATAKRE